MLSDLSFRLRALFRRGAMEAEMDEELRSHFENHVEKLVTSGLPREEALRRARLEFGGYEQLKEEIRDARGVSLVEATVQDLRYALRMLRNTPSFTAVAILTLALGIGANTAIFSVIDSVLLRPLPYRDPAGLVMVWENDSQHPNPHNTVSPPDFQDWQSRNSVFSEMAAIFDQHANLTGNGLPQEVVLQDVSANFFSVLGVTPILGPGFTAENGKAGHDNVVVLSYGFWKERFAGEAAVIGKTLLLNGHAQTIVGVAPEDFSWFIKDGSFTGAKPQMWTPFVFPASFSDRKEVGRFLSVVARLKPGATVSQAKSEMNTIAARIAEEYPDFNGYWGANVVPVRDQISGDLQPALLILFGAVSFVLLISCANVSSLLLARAAAREREFAVRTAIGASPWRIARQLLTESVLLALIGGAIGVALAVWGTNFLLAASPGNLLDLRSIPIDWRVLAFAGGATLLAGMLFGVLPSYICAHSGISETLKEGGRGSSGKRRQLARGAFVVVQMCLALVLLAGSGLLIRSFVRLVGVDPGFDASHLLTFKVSLPSSKYGNDKAILAYFQQLHSRVSHLPGVRSVSMNSFPPFSGLGSATGVHILSQPGRSLMDLPDAAVRVVGADYFATMQIPLHAGRTFHEQELTEERHVVIINQAFADQYLKGVNPLGQKAVIYMKSLEESKNTPSEIIGVVGDVRQMGLDTPAEPTVYWPHPELVISEMTIVVRTANEPLALVSAVRNELQQMDPEQPMAAVSTMDQLLAGTLSRSRFMMLVLGVLAALALVLACVGIYGVIAYSVTQRTQEFGIRMALGANRRDVFRLVLGEGTRLTLLGIGLGIVAGLLVTRLMATLLYGVSATDPLTFTAVALLLAFVALAACYIPARRATKVDPIVALRYE
jgi:putative ABC transport system permease protein